MDTTGGALAFKSTLDDTDFLRRINGMEESIKKLTGTADTEGNKLSNAFKSLGQATALIGVGGLLSFGGLGKQILTVRGECEKLEVAFKTMLGSEAKAADLLSDVTMMAAKTPFTLDQVANGAKQLLAYNVVQEDIIETLTRLGNVAAGVGVDVSRLILVYGQVKAKGVLFAQDMRQFTEAGVPIISELAKVMGVTEKAIIKMVENGQVGFEEVAAAINSMTNAGGKFYNLMEAQSKTVGGMISNLGDAWDRMLDSIGKENSGIIKEGVSGLTGLVENYQQVIDIVEMLVITYGGYRAAVVLNAIALKFQKTMALEAMMGHNALTAANTMLIASTEAARRSVSRLTAAMASNPLTVFLTIISAISAALFVFKREATEVVDIEDMMAEASEKIAGNMGEMKGKIEPLITAIKSETIAEEQRLKAYNKLKEIAPEVLRNLTAEEAKIADLAARTKEWYENYLKIISVNVFKEQLESAGRTLAIAQQELETKQELKKVEDARIANARKNENANSRGTTQGYQTIGQTVDSKTMQKEVDIAQKAVDTANESWVKLQALVSKTESTLLSTSTKTVDGERTAAQEIITLQQTIADYEEKLANLSADKSADSERRKLANLKQVAEDRIKVLRGEFGKRKNIEDTSKPVKEELDKIKQSYVEYYEYIELMGNKADMSRFKSLMAYGDTYSKYLQNKIAELEAKINTGKFDTIDLTKLAIYKKEQADATPTVTPADEIRNRLGDVKDAAEEGKNELEKVRSYIFEIDKLVSEIKAGSGKFASLNPEERENTLADLARERIASEKSAAKYEMERVYALSQEYMTYEQKKVKITEDATDEVLLLLKYGYTEQADMRRKQYANDIAELQVHNAEMLKEFDILKVDLANASVDLLRTALNVVEQIDTSKLTAEKAKEVKDAMLKIKEQMGKINFFDFKYIKQLKKDMGDMSIPEPERLEKQVKYTDAIDKKVRSAVEAMQQFAGAIQGVNEELSNALNTLGNMVNGMAMMAKGDYLGGGMMILSSIITEISNDGGTAQEKQASAVERLGRTLEKLNSILEQQQRLIDRAFGLDKIAAFDTGIETLRGNVNELVKDINSIIPSFNETIQWYAQTQISPDEYASFLAKYTFKPIEMPELTGNMSTTEVNAILAQTQAQAEAIEMLMNEFIHLPPILEEQMKKDLEALYSYSEELEALIDQQQQYLTGTTSASVTDAIIEGFRNGFDSAADFADTFEDLMKQAVLNSLKIKYLEPAIKQWMELFTQYMEDTELTDTERDALKAEWDAIVLNGSRELEALGSALNLDFGDSSTSQLEGAIRGMTEETAGVVAGQMNAIRMSITSVLETMDRMLDAQVETAINTRYLKEIYNKINTGGINPISGEGISY